MIDLFRPFVPNETAKALAEQLKTRWLGQGPKVNEFEREFRRKFGVKHCITMNSCTAALDTAYELIGLKKGDEVISTPFTCTATNLELLRRGIKIVWADILEETMCIDPLDVRSKITDKTKAIVQVHIGGIKADVGESHIPVVSDAAQSLGFFNGDYTCCSFQAIKTISTPDGGALICDDDKDAKKAKLIRWFGIDREKKTNSGWQAYRERKMTFNIELMGTKRQWNDIAAIFGIEALKYYDKIIAHNNILFDIYRKRLKGIKICDSKDNLHWLVTVLVDKRNDLARKLYEHGIDTNVVHVRNDLYKIFGGKRQDLPTMNRIEHQYLCLPIGMHVTEEEVEGICSVIQEGW